MVVPNKILKTNKAAWEQVAEKFSGGLYLPSWGPFGEFRKIDLLGEIKGKTIMEIGFGSGHSIHYLIEKGAKKIYGLDISEKQKELASDLNKKAIEEGKVVLYLNSMEENLQLSEKVDFVFSVYAIGWTTSPKKTLKNIRSYLNKGGYFTWSWEHPFYSRFNVENNKLVMDKSYLDEGARFVADWVGSSGAYIQHRKISTWINLLNESGFKISEVYEPNPEIYSERQSDNPSRYYSKFRANLVTPTIIFKCQAI